MVMTLVGRNNLPQFAICIVMCIMAVTVGGSVGECGRFSQPSWLLGVL